MRQQTPPAGRRRRILARAEHHVLPDGEGAGADCARRFCGAGVMMHAHPAEVAPQPLLHKSARFDVERPTRRVQHVMDDRRRLPGGVRDAPHLLVLPIRGRAFARNFLRRRGHLGLRNAHHLVGDAVGFVLERIVGLSDNEYSWRRSDRSSSFGITCPVRWKRQNFAETPRQARRRVRVQSDSCFFLFTRSVIARLTPPRMSNACWPDCSSNSQRPSSAA